jgi:hypothetical protein
VADRHVLMGTCSWTDESLTQGTDWYPRTSMSAADRLAFYSPLTGHPTKPQSSWHDSRTAP